MKAMPSIPPKIVTSLKRLRSGGLSVKSNDINILKLQVLENDITIDLRNLEVVKDFFRPFQKTRTFDKEEESILDQLKKIKGFAENLKNENMTIRITTNEEPVLVLGEKAKPRLSRLILGSNIQADIIKIISLIRKLR